jgi:large subunit ribosomal protein L6e
MAKGARKATRNPELIRGVNRFGRSASQKRRRVYLHTKKTTAVKPVAAVAAKEPRWYAGDDVAKPLTSRKNRHKAPGLRKSITPGTILILLAGRFKGKRVVFLKQLASGLLLVSGAYSTGRLLCHFFFFFYSEVPICVS